MKILFIPCPDQKKVRDNLRNTKYPKHERDQIKIEDNDNKKLGTQNRAENKLQWATSLRTLEPEFHCPEHI